MIFSRRVKNLMIVQQINNNTQDLQILLKTNQLLIQRFMNNFLTIFKLTRKHYIKRKDF